MRKEKENLKNKILITKKSCWSKYFWGSWVFIKN